MKRSYILFIVTLFLPFYMMAFRAPAEDTFLVKKCGDFSLSGDGSNAEWNKAGWNPMMQLDSGTSYKSRFKIMYSPKGIYLLFNGEDKKITTEFENDFENLFQGDVFEVFFHTNTQIPMYLEYEINALNKELVLLIPNFNKKNYGWIPWHYTGNRMVKKMVSVVGGKAVKGGAISEWSAELFFPYAIFAPLDKVPATSGATWNANFYRLDYDGGKMIKYAWAPVSRSFHEFEKFRAIKFE